MGVLQNPRIAKNSLKTRKTRFFLDHSAFLLKQLPSKQRTSGTATGMKLPLTAYQTIQTACCFCTVSNHSLFQTSNNDLLYPIEYHCIHLILTSINSKLPIS
jgi:hypothetical protein